MGYVLSDDFKSRYPDCPTEKCSIILSLGKKPSDLLLELCGKIRPWVNSCGIQFRVEYKSFFGTKHNIEV